MPRLKYSAASREDLKEIARYIARDKPVAARQWVAKLREKCRLVAKHPEIGDDRSDLGIGIRTTYVGSFNFTFSIRAVSFTINQWRIKDDPHHRQQPLRTIDASSATIGTATQLYSKIGKWSNRS